MKTIILSFMFLTGILFGCKQAPIVDYRIIPEPQTIAYSPGSFSLNETVKIAFPQGAVKEADILKTYLLSDFGLKTQTTEN